MPRVERRIEFRVSDDLARVAERLARKRKFLTAGGKPNLSQLLRALIEEAGVREDDGTVGPSEDDTRTNT
jgi:hypothetical protein